MASVLLNGWSATARCWQEALADNALCADWQVLDLHDFQSWEQLESELDQRLGANDVLAGWSMGGMLALRYASRTQTALKALLTFNTNLRFVQSSNVIHALSADVFEQFSALIANGDADAIARRFSALMLKGSPHKEERRLLKAYYSVETLPSREALSRLLYCLGSLDVSGDVNASSLPPTLHFLGTQDVLVPHTCAELLTTATGGEIYHYSGAHVPFLQAWPEIAQRTNTFLESITHA